MENALKFEKVSKPALSHLLQLPFALIPVLQFTGDPTIMKSFQNGRYVNFSENKTHNNSNHFSCFCFETVKASRWFWFQFVSKNENYSVEPPTTTSRERQLFQNNFFPQSNHKSEPLVSKSARVRDGNLCFKC